MYPARCRTENDAKLFIIIAPATVIFKGKYVFGALSPVSVSAARQRLEAGAAKAHQNLKAGAATR